MMRFLSSPGRLRTRLATSSAVSLGAGLALAAAWLVVPVTAHAQAAVVEARVRELSGGRVGVEAAGAARGIAVGDSARFFDPSRSATDPAGVQQGRWRVAAIDGALIWLEPDGVALDPRPGYMARIFPGSRRVQTQPSPRAGAVADRPPPPTRTGAVDQPAREPANPPQPASQSGVTRAGARFGAIGGANLADFRTQNVDEAVTRRTGFMAGVMVAAVASPSFHAVTELLYAQKGAQFPDSENAIYAIDWIQVSVLGQIRFPTSGAAVPYLLVGPAAGFRARCQLRTTDEDITCDDLNVRIKSTDFGGVAGAGIELGALTLSARYEHGFVNISDDPGETVNNRVLTFALGIIFNPQR
jgi:hypothetical protein